MTSSIINDGIDLRFRGHSLIYSCYQLRVCRPSYFKFLRKQHQHCPPHEAGGGFGAGIQKKKKRSTLGAETHVLEERQSLANLI